MPRPDSITLRPRLIMLGSDVVPQIPNAIIWDFNYKSLYGKKYLKDIEFLKNNTSCDMVIISPRAGIQIGNYRQCHDVIAEITEKAHGIGLKIGLHLPSADGFYNAPVNAASAPEIDQALLFPLDNTQDAEGVVHEYEMIADENGYACCQHQSKWVRQKIRPLFCELLCVFAFKKTADGFYDPSTLQDVTSCARIIDSRPSSLLLEIEAGKDNAGKALFVMVVQYHNYNAVTSDSNFFSKKKVMDVYADVPLDAICLDEFGYISLNTTGIRNGSEEPYRGHFYTHALAKYYREQLNTDLAKEFFHIRYAPIDDEGVRIRAINHYFEELRKPPLKVEWEVAKYAQKLWGEDVFLTCHNTFHNDIDNDEIWRTACNWWDIPRKFGHTDENIAFPVRMGIMLAAKEPLMLDMFYSKCKDFEEHYAHITIGAPFGCREFHHAYNDFTFGCSFTEPELLKNVRILDEAIAQLNDFQYEYPRLDLLIIYGAGAQNNWYPNANDRNVFDINGNLKIIPKCEEIWQAGYRCALVPDYAITDGRICINENKICFNGYEFTHCLFMYPQYAKKEVLAMLDAAGMAGVKIAAVGQVNLDFEAQPAQLHIPCYPVFSMDIMNDLSCPKSAIPGGCVAKDGSFVLVSEGGLLRGEKTKFDFIINSVRYNGIHTGILAYRPNGNNVYTEGCELFINGQKIKLK